MAGFFLKKNVVAGKWEYECDHMKNFLAGTWTDQIM